MNEDQWNYLCKDTVDAMIEHVKPFLSPISYTTDEDYGKLHGTGSYITFDDKEYLITNEHVGSLDKKQLCKISFLMTIIFIF